jgi:hypothetical protein
LKDGQIEQTSHSKNQGFITIIYRSEMPDQKQAKEDRYQRLNHVQTPSRAKD